MALRIKSHWMNEDRERSLPEVGSALAFIAWRIALDKAINLHCERFIYASDGQRLEVIQEYLAFLIQLADRLAHRRLNDADRRVLITAFASNLCGHIQDNSQDLLGPGDYGGPFIARLNTRSDEYAEFQFDDDGPSYAVLRHLGFQIQSLMGDARENRWVIDQVMDRDGWDACRAFAKAFADLFD